MAANNIAGIKPGSINYRQVGAEQYLMVNQVQLPLILKVISEKNKILIHYSVLPELPVSASCIGASVKVVLECLLSGTVDMVYRYSEGKVEQQLLEVWLLDSSLAQLGNNFSLCTGDTKAQLDSEVEVAYEKEEGNKEPSKEEKHAFRMQMAVSGDSKQRSQAIAYLATNALLDDSGFNKILQQALTDEDAEIRGQAVSAWVRREGEQASLFELQQALQDTDVSVRLMALQQVKETKELIQQALNDESEYVRKLALIKLQTE